MNSRTMWSLLAVGCLLAQGCGDSGVGAAELATRQGESGDMAGNACAADIDCPQGEECEFEHGESFCKPHGGDGAGGSAGSGGSGGSAGNGGSAGSAGSGGGAGNDGHGGMMDCESDYDCPQGEECEFEHGGSFCKPHGGDDDCDDDAHRDGGHHHDDTDCDCDDDSDDRSGSNSGKG